MVTLLKHENNRALSMVKLLSLYNDTKGTVSVLSRCAENNRWETEGASIAQWLAYLGQHTPKVGILASGPSCPGSIPSIPQKNLRGKIVAVAEVNQPRCLEESEKWLENVD